MKKINSQALYPLIALVILVFTLSKSMFSVPPLGKLLNPFTGIVQNNRDRGLNASQLTFHKMGLNDTVSIFFDQRKVPHIYANNNTDLYFAQGYVTAVLRLWQMDFMSHAVAGWMSEIFPAGYLEYDRNQRRIGMLEAAKAALSEIEKDAETLRALTAYTKGVNAYISQLDYKEMPLEYKLMDYRPEKWTNLKSVLLMKYMASTLSGYEEDFSMSWMMLALGEERFNKFYPDFTSRISPMDGSTPAVTPAVAAYIRQPDYLRFSFFASKSVLPQNTYNPKLGSNSWVVSGKKTVSGHPILCADPHLNLSLPAIWLEMQLSSPDMNVYGVSIPGTPSVIIGFNENIAWGLTNGADDAKDWYRLKINNDYSKYEIDGKWKELAFTVDTIKRKGQTDFYDTVYHTVHGPVPYTKDFSFGHPELLNNALRWELHKPSNEFLTFILLNRAKNYSEYRAAISHYATPVQNFTFACKDNTIAVNHQGRLPVKHAGQGKFVQDGTQSAQLYTQYIPNDSLPAVLNPACNYVVSANQHPTNAGYHWYYNGYFSENRANRITQLLEKENDFDVEKMKGIQLDNTSYFATDALPVLLNTMDRKSLPAAAQKRLAALKNWKGDYNSSDQEARLFELWWNNVKDYTWDELKNLDFYSRMPDDAVLLDLIAHEPDDRYFDKQGTTKVETAPDIISQAFSNAVASYDLLAAKGESSWGSFNKVNIKHFTNLDAFSRTNLPSSGYTEAINAVSSNWGPSWRMIVELDDRPRAFGIYAGGQSGDVGSLYYDNFIDDWSRGKYYPLTFFMSMNEAMKQSSGAWKLK